MPAKEFVHKVFECNETAYMAMDYIQGYDLLQTVEGSAPPLSPKEIIAHLHTMLDAVGHVHAGRLVLRWHRKVGRHVL